MKTLNIFLAFIIAVIVMSCNRQTADNGKAVNPLLGDISFVSKFGHEPTATTDEDLRIKTHLEYVEKLLRLRDVSSLTPQLKLRRNHLLDFLHDYWTAGIFPRNYDYPDKRVPCFIDKNGRICAVGYLIEQTVGRQTAEQINEKHKYEKLMAINDRTVDSWVATSGLTKEECAMIQPTYGEPIDYNNNHISTNYAITSSVLGATNISLSTINIIQISNGTDNKTAAIIGLLTGAGGL